MRRRSIEGMQLREYSNQAAVHQLHLIICSIGSLIHYESLSVEDACRIQCAM